MTARARLLALRLQGFKSFAERTNIEFGPGISAVVGPNGSGKSNLADALRWSLGEQGRSLRARRSEDVIWAGSERRKAQGMADVTLVLDNGDALLPVEYGIVELGRRLYRSGENDYLLNRQRVRLRDLVDLLDAAHLADNAFLFIGQGMVDQALALRPEERRPLFEEVAGVRRHERRRRKAEDQLAESESNLARVEDILAELRPQARRLGQLADQQATRLTAGEELAAALVTAAHARWHDTARRAAETAERTAAARAAADHATAELQQIEAEVASVSAGLASRTGAEQTRRAEHDARLADVTGLRLRDARIASELEALARDRARLLDERAAAEADLDRQRRILVEPLPPRDLDLEASLAGAERSLAEALEELGALRAASRARGDELAALRRAEAARASEMETARRHAAEAARRAVEELSRQVATAERHAAAEQRLATAREALRAALEAEQAAIAEREAARAEAERQEGLRQATAERSAHAGSAHAALHGRVAAAETRIAEEESRGIARAARRVGGRRVDEDLGVEPAMRAAVEAALGELARAYLVDRAGVGGLAAERGTLVVVEAVREHTAPERDAVRSRLAALGGGLLGDAIRRDPTAAVQPLLARVGWLPTLEAAIEAQAALPPGWLVVVRDGSASVDATTVRMGRPEGVLERRAELDRLRMDLERLAGEARDAARAAEAATAAAADARRRLDAAREREAAAHAVRRRVEEADRTAARETEALAREAAWHAAQATRLGAEADRARAGVAALEAEAAQRADAAAPTEDGGADAAIGSWEARVAELRARRDRLAAEHATHDGTRREAEGRRARAEAAASYDEQRIATAERSIEAIDERQRAAELEREALTVELAAATEHERRAREALDAIRTAEAAERARLAEIERSAGQARERLRTFEDRARAAQVADLEARLGLDSLREQLLVELTALGELAVRHLATAAGGTVPESVSPFDDPEVAEETVAIDAALRAAAPVWAALPPATEPPSPGRLAVLRRRFHELGAANPFAVDEYRALRERLEGLETQARDLRDAIAKTRTLIGELDAMIATQFRATFAALETTFDRRFQQLFGGGFARLSLTDPTDLASTGIEIVARPPGKKPQTLAMLSGGERALTAVALLFAMLEVRPVPFCVLDEVDAALDEANVGRFTEALRSLTDQTQFIVITHNRGTIEIADALYGVTVGDDSVSRVISLRLEEAQAIADHQRGARQALLAEAPVG